MPSETKDMPSGSRRLAIPNKKQSKKPTLFVWNWDFMQLKLNIPADALGDQRYAFWVPSTRHPQ
jgi:hypothetical protein